MALDSTPDRLVDVTRELHTLDIWRDRLLGQGRMIECSSMRLIGHDHEDAIFTGPGRIEIRSDMDVRFFLYGRTDNRHSAMRKLQAARQNPYEIADQFRLFATDYSNNEWIGGWTAVDFFADAKNGWPLMGGLNGLSTRSSGAWVASESSVELLIVPPVSIPMSESLTAVSSVGKSIIEVSERPGRHVIEALGTKISFSHDPSGECLWIVAKTSAKLQHPFAERWLCEPLRILLGAHIYPRLLARNFGNGTALVTLLPSPGARATSSVGLMQHMVKVIGHRTTFWRLYAEILEMIARDGTAPGQHGVDAHEVTRYYEELIQADRGSRWVMLLTLASTVEALAKALMSRRDLQSEWSATDLASMRAHIKGWTNNMDLRARMLSSLSQIGKLGVLAFLRDLAAQGRIPNHCETWRKIRNSVMHGELSEPWPTKETDAHVHELIQLVHALTRERIAVDRAAGYSDQN